METEKTALTNNTTSAKELGRRGFIKTAGLFASVFALSPQALLAKHQTKVVQGDVFKCDPYILAISNTSVTIAWVTKTPCHGRIEYGTDPNLLDQTSRQVQDGMAHIGTVHQVTLQGLKEGQAYHYRVVAEEVTNIERKNTRFGTQEQSTTYPIATRGNDTQEVSFVVFNDTHARPETYGNLMPLSNIEKPDFIALNGDQMSSVSSEDHLLTNVIHPLTALGASSIPIVYSRGNHETWGSHARQLPDYVGGHAQKFYYGISYGPLYLIVLDSGETREDDFVNNAGLIEFDQYRVQQGEWLKKEVEKPTFKAASYRVVLTHIPPFYAARELHAAQHYFNEWGPTLNASGIDLMLCGHIHRPGIHPAVSGRHHFPIVIGGGPKDDTRTIMSVKVNHSALSLKLIHESGDLLGELNI